MKLFDPIFIAPVSIALFVFSLMWLLRSAIQNGSVRYKSFFEEETTVGLRELYVFIDPASLWPPVILISVCLGAIIYVISTSVILSLLIILMTLRTPKLLIKRANEIRLRRFNEQLPESCMLIAGALKSGMSILEAIQMLSSASKAPFSQEISFVLREYRVGVPLDQALISLRSRLKTESCIMFTSTLIISLRSGGSVASLLEQVSVNIRDRLILNRKMYALTLQGKLQAWVLGLMPLVLWTVLSIIDPEISGNVFNDTVGKWFVSMFIFLELMGCLMLRRILHHRI